MENLFLYKVRVSVSGHWDYYHMLSFMRDFLGSAKFIPSDKTLSSAAVSWTELIFLMM